MHSIKESCTQQIDYCIFSGLYQSICPDCWICTYIANLNLQTCWEAARLLSQEQETYCFSSFSEDNNGRLLEVLPCSHRVSLLTFKNVPKMFVSRIMAGIVLNSILVTCAQFIPGLLSRSAIPSESQFLDSDIKYFSLSQVSVGKGELLLLAWELRSSFLRQGSRRTCVNHDLSVPAFLYCIYCMKISMQPLNVMTLSVEPTADVVVDSPAYCRPAWHSMERNKISTMTRKECITYITWSPAYCSSWDAIACKEGFMTRL